jgi:GNAT superfamily N-acetyltransferase
MRVGVGGRMSESLVSRIDYRWPQSVDEELAASIVALYNDSIRTESILGFTAELSDEAGRNVTDAIAGALRRGEKHFFGIYAGVALIGMALLTPNSLPNCRHIVEWSKGIIHSRYRGSGVLKPALHALGKRCKELGWAIVTLDVRAESRAHQIWSLFGFQEYGRLGDYARVDGRSHAGAFMCTTVDNLLQRCGSADLECRSPAATAIPTNIEGASNVRETSL